MSDIIKKKLDQVYSDIFTVIDEEKVRKIFKEIGEVNKKMEYVSDNDKKIQRLLKEMDMNGLIKQIS